MCTILGELFVDIVGIRFVEVLTKIKGSDYIG